MGLFSSFKSKSAANAAGLQVDSRALVQRCESSEQQAVAGASLSDIPSRSTSPPVYQHRPLRQDEIRLFVLQKGRRDEPIRLQVQHCAIDQKPPYTALSFVWGNSPDTANVFVDGGALKVTQTLLVALRSVRLANRDMLVWADQVCINQLDEAEKSQQVKYMSVIYPQASKVLCWLGEDDGTVKLAFSFLRQWAAASGEGKKKEKLRLKAIARSLQSSDERTYVALESLFSRPWWRRAWTLQEVRPSDSNHPVLVCGRHSMTWYDFFYGCYTMFSAVGNNETTRIGSAAVGYTLQMLRVSYAQKESLCLSLLVPKNVTREATDPRDKVFALLGITETVGLQYPPADYRLSVEQVCIKYTRAIIEVDQSLDILLSVSRHQNKTELPSWCIKLDMLRGEDCNTHQLDADATGKPFGPNSQHRYNATLQVRPTVKAPESDFDGVLKLAGDPVDTIERIISPDDISSLFKATGITWTGMLDYVARLCSQQRLPSRYRWTNSSIAAALLNTLTVSDFYLVSQTVHDARTRNLRWDALYYAYQLQVSSQRTRVGKNAAALDLQDFISFAQHQFSFHARSDGGGTTRPGNAPTKQALESSMVAWLERTILDDLLEGIRSNAVSRCVFVTSKGMIGLGPHDLQRGDHLCLLFGASTPFALRPSRARSGAYELLDEVYCEGIMMGEALSEYVRNGELKAPAVGWTKYALV